MQGDINKRALLVGIDEYEHFNPLSGCVNDVVALTPLLQKHADGDPNFNCRAYVSGRDEVTRRAVLKGLDVLLAPGADSALFYFAGHGLRAANNVVLATQDAGSADDGVSLSDVMVKVQQSKVPEVSIILDCCYSGGAGGVPQLGVDAATLREGLALLTASGPDQTAAETDLGRGLFSSLLYGAIDGGAADVLGQVTLAGVYAYLAESLGGWGQQPMFKANLRVLRTLRNCKPALSRPDLRQLMGFFPKADHYFPLDRTYEPTEKAFTAARGDILKLLQRGRASRLVEPVDADHLYFACIEGKGCRLTPLGAHYWRLREQERI